VTPSNSCYSLELVREGEAGATLVTPPDGSLDDEARRIVQAVNARYDVELAIVPGDQAVQELPTPHAIALGCLADNPLVEWLYYRWCTLVDRWYPGLDGWAVQSIPSPFRQGDHVLLLGGSDRSGIRGATGRFIERLDTCEGGQIPWLLEVQLGEGHLPLPVDRVDGLGTAASQVVTPESALPDRPYTPGFRGGSARDHLLRLGMYGPHADNYHFSRSSQFGLRYLYTGRAEDAGLYRTTLLAEARSGVVQKLYHYKSLRMIQLWSLLGDSPVFDGDREEISAAIRDYLLEESGVANMEAIRAASTGSEIFNRHVACDALNLWAGADWLWRRTGQDRWLEDRRVADLYFESQAGTDVPLTGLTEGYASYLEVYLEWMLLSCPNRIANDPDVRLWARRVMGLCTNAGQLVPGPQTDAGRYPYHLLRKLSHLLNDGRYLYAADLRERQVQRGMDRVSQFSAGQAYAGDVEALEPAQETGLTVYPMNERLRQWVAPTIGKGKGFDRAVMRGGWEEQDDYLMVVGVRSAVKSQANVGALAAYERFGRQLITSDSVLLYPACADPWRQSAVTVNAGGLGAGMLEGATLLTADEVAGGHLLSYRVDAPGLWQWVRRIYWQPSAYVLVIDSVKVTAPDEAFTLGVNWQCAGKILAVDNGLATLGFGPDADVQFHVQVSGDVFLESEANTYPTPGAPPGTPPIEEVVLHATKDGCARDGEEVVATLLHAVPGTQGPCYRLIDCEEGWAVQGPEETLGFGRDALEGEMTIEVCLPAAETDESRPRPPAGQSPQAGRAGSKLGTRWAYRLPGQVSAWTADGDEVALGTEEGDVAVLDGEGREIWTATCDAAVTALALVEDGLITGTRSGEVCRFSKDGVAQWRHLCRFRDERPFWPWWFLATPSVAALATARDPATGKDLVVAGTGSTSLNFLEGRSGALMEDALSRYGWPDRIQAHVSAHTGRLQFLVGHSWLTSGSAVRTWYPPVQAQDGARFFKSVDPLGRTVGEWDGCGALDFRVGPLVHDGPERVVLLRHGAVNQITAYEEATGDPLWDAGLGGVPVALAVVPGESAVSARCCVADRFGWLVAFDGSGRRVAAARVAHSLQGMHAGLHGDLALWNLEDLLIVREACVTDQYKFEGCPLGWVSHAERSGLLCAHQGRLMMHDVQTTTDL
jgi:hypothetical protein